MQLQIRDLAPHEIPWFATFAERLFRETYATTHAEMLDPYCAGAFAPGVQERELGEEGAGVLVAEVDGRPAGYAQYRRRQPPVEVPGGAPAIEIARFYVDRPYHGSGVAHRLMGAVLALASERGARLAWLQAAEYNERALRFYAKAGFHTAARVPFDFAGVHELDYLLAIPLPIAHRAADAPLREARPA